MRLVPVVLALCLAGCLPTSSGPLAPPSVEEAQTLVEEIIDAGIARDWERLCANATGTCESELEGLEHLAPSEPPRIAAVTVHEPTVRGDSWTSGGVLFVLCGSDATDEPYESEVFVFNDGARLLVTAAVYWIGTGVIVSAPGEPALVGGEPTPGAPRC